MNRVLGVMALALPGAMVFLAPQPTRIVRQTEQREEWKAPARASKKKNPVPADAKSIAAGQATYSQQCLPCHGREGRGDGPAAKDLPEKVRDLANPRILADTDGALFWKLAEGREPMPSYEKLATEEERWSVINYLRFLTLAEPRRALSAILRPYLAAQGVLVKDDLEGARAGLSELEQALAKLSSVEPKGMDAKLADDWKQVQVLLQSPLSMLGAASDLAAFRKTFAALSDPLSEAVATFGHAEEMPLFVFECSKASPGSVVSWIQSGDQAQNPYLGLKAPTCGERTRGLDPVVLRGRLEGDE